MILCCVAGANGSGKSTLIKNLLQLEYQGMPYVCPDAQVQFVDKNITDIKDRYLIAMSQCETIRKNMIDEGVSFITETVLSTTDKIDELNYAKQNGFRIRSIYVGTSSPTINIERVKCRVAEGGHSVPKDKIISRYTRSLYNLEHLINISDEIQIYDNSGKNRNTFVEVCHIIDSEVKYFNDAYKPLLFVKKFILPFI